MSSSWTCGIPAGCVSIAARSSSCFARRPAMSSRMAGFTLSIRSATVIIAISTRWTARRRRWKMSRAFVPGCRKSSMKTWLSTGMRSTPMRRYASSRSGAMPTRSSSSRPAARSLPTIIPSVILRTIITDAWSLPRAMSRSGAWNHTMAGCCSVCRIPTIRPPCVLLWSSPRLSRCSPRTCDGTSSPISIPSAMSTTPASKATAANSYRSPRPFKKKRSSRSRRRSTAVTAERKTPSAWS